MKTSGTIVGSIANIPKHDGRYTLGKKGLDALERLHNYIKSL